MDSTCSSLLLNRHGPQEATCEHMLNVGFRAHVHICEGVGHMSGGKRRVDHAPAPQMLRYLDVTPTTNFHCVCDSSFVWVGRIVALRWAACGSAQG